MSLIEAASAVGEFREDALGQVLALYWKPVYKYIRLKWNKNNEDAKDLTQNFFANALRREFLESFDPSLASFRTYLRMALDRFLSNERAAEFREKRGGGVSFTSLDFASAEAEAVESRAEDSPEEMFQREWRRQVFTLAIDDLRRHCQETGKQLHFQVFESYDLAEDGRHGYAELAARLGIPVTALNNYLAWARRMLRGFVGERLRGVTSGDDELRDEMRSVFTAQR